MKRSIKLFLLTIGFVITAAVGAKAATSTVTANEYYYNCYKGIYPNLNSAYSIPDGEGYVNSKTGSLSTNTEDYRIKGKNGFDIPIIRSFQTVPTSEYISSSEHNKKRSKEEYYYVPYICSFDNKTVYVYFKNEKEVYEADSEFVGTGYRTSGKNMYANLKNTGSGNTYTYTRANADAPSVSYRSSYYTDYLSDCSTRNAFSELGSSMKIAKPSIYTYDYDSYDDYRDFYVIFQDIYGDAYSMEFSYQKSGDIRILKDVTHSKLNKCKYTFSAVNNNDITETATHPLGFTYNSTMTSDSGEVYYFNETFGSNCIYDIVAVSDRYGNTYLIDGTAGYKITTPEGVVYTCGSSGITRTINGEVTQLVSYGSERLNSAKDTNNIYDIDDEFTFTVTKNSGTSAQISANEKNVVKYKMKQELKYTELLHNLALCKYLLPYEIEFPNGLTKYIEYGKFDWIVGLPRDTFAVDSYYVSRYYEKSGNKIRNESLYTLKSVKDYKTYYMYITETCQMVQCGGKTSNTITNTFDKYGRLTNKSTYTSYAGSIDYEYTYVNYNDDAQIDGEKVRYSRGHSYADIIRSFYYTDKYYLREETDGERNTTYTYHTDGYYIPNETVRKKDANTNVKTQNVLTEDKKSVAQINTYENDELKRSVFYTYDSYGNIASESVSLGNDDPLLTQHTYTYAPDGGYTHIQKQCNMLNGGETRINDIVTTTVYDLDYRPVSTTDDIGNTTTMTYDMCGRLLSTSYPDGTSETYSYDIENNIVTYTAQNGTVYKVYFDAWGNRIKTTAVLGGAETKFDEYTYDDLGRLATLKRYTTPSEYTEARYEYTDFDEIKSEKIYNEQGVLVRNVSASITYVRSENGTPNPTTTYTITGDDGNYAQYKEVKNCYGDVLQKGRISGSDERTYTYTYDSLGNALTATDPSGAVTTMEYDIFANPIKITYPDGTFESFEYNALNLTTSKTDKRGNKELYYYDNAGRLYSVDTPFDGTDYSKVHYLYDRNGNVSIKSVRSGYISDRETNNFIQYFYDSMNRLSYSVTMPQGVQRIYTVYTYDSIGNPISVKTGAESSGLANINNATGGVITTYTYDALGRKTGETAPDGSTISYEYDLQGRLTKKTVGNNAPETYTYDVFDNLISKQRDGESISYTYNAVGARTSMTDSTGTTNYAYDPFGNLTTEAKNGIVKSYTYDVLGNRTSFNAANGESSVIGNTYAYDNMGRLTSVTNGADTVSYTYDANSNRLSTAVNGTVTNTATYNKGNLPVEIKNFDGGTLVDTTAFAYYFDGNVRNQVVTTANDSTSTNYRYDGVGRLTKERTYSESDTFDYTNEYFYDNYGNRRIFMQTDDQNNTITNVDYTFDSKNKLITSDFRRHNKTDSSLDKRVISNYAYDDFGNTVSVSENDELAKTYTYDAFNRLSTYTADGVTASYTYDGDNLRQSKTVNGSTVNHLLDGANVVADIYPDSTNIYVYGNGVELFKTGGQTSRYTKSYRGDVTAVTTGDTKTEYFYDAFGNKQTDTDTSTNPFEYCGEYFDDETGLIYLRNRYYDPTNGRFVTEDPARDGENWYVYAGNNPVNFVDPDGKVSEALAKRRIRDSAQYIVSAANEYGVNPGILAAVIYAEQVLNVTYTENIEDAAQAFLGANCSVGIAQVRISTAKRIEDAGYIEKTTETKVVTYLFTIPIKNEPVYSTDLISRDSNLYSKLKNDEVNIRYAAAYLALIQDLWKEAYPEIDGRTAILATLYNIGEYGGSKGINSNPESNPFGDFAKESYSDMCKILREK